MADQTSTTTDVDLDDLRKVRIVGGSVFSDDPDPVHYFLPGSEVYITDDDGKSGESRWVNAVGVNRVGEELEQFVRLSDIELVHGREA